MLSIATYDAPVWSSTCDSNYLKLQDVHNKSLQVTGNYHSGYTLITNLMY